MKILLKYRKKDINWLNNGKLNINQKTIHVWQEWNCPRNVFDNE